MELMELVQEEALVAELKRKLEDEDLKPEQKVLLLNDALNSETTQKEKKINNGFSASVE